MTTDVSIALATLQLDPDNRQALNALADVHPGNGGGVDREALSMALSDARRWHRERGDFDLCVQLIELELAWTLDGPRRADLLHEKGRILSDELLRDQEGQHTLREALENDPQHAPSLESRAQMALVQSNWKAIAARYLQQAETAADPALASSLYASVAEFHLKYGAAGKVKEGETFLRKSLEADPRNRRPSMHLERLLRDAGRWDELLPVYVKRAEVATARDERALAEVAAADLSARIKRPDEALLHYRKALEANPIEHRALRPVVASLTADKNWPELVKVLESAARTKRGEQDVALLVELGTLFWKQLEQTPQAESYFRRVRKYDPANRAMVDFYREYLTARNELPQLLSVLAGAQKTETDLDRRVAMGVEMARAADARPQNAEKAIELWKGLLRLRPHLPEAVQALHRLYTRTEKWNALLELLKEDLELVPASDVNERVKRYLEIVAIYRDHLNLDVMVVNTYLNVLALRPDHPAALAALAVRYEAQGRWTDLIQILTRQAEALTDPAEKVVLHRRVATLWAEKLGKHHNAVASLEKILESAPSDAETRARLKELYTRSRSWRQLLEVYRKELPYVAAGEQKIRLAEMARIAADRLSDVREAINLWNQLLAIADNDPDALAGLAALYERERRWPALIEILDRQSQNAHHDPAAELPLLERRGMLLYEKLGAGQAAIEVFRRIQTVQPGNARATRALREIYAQLGDFAALEALYVEQGAYGELCDQLTSLADRTADMAARTRMLERVALLATEKLRQPERALKAYERILATDPHNRRAAQALVPLYRASQKWPRLLSTYEALLAVPPGQPDLDVAERLEVLNDARQICEQRLGSKSLAFQWCARAFEVAPRDPRVIADLDRLAAEADEWGGLAALFGKRLDATRAAGDPEERLWLLRRSLRIATSRLYKPVDARRFAEEILALTGGDTEAETALEQIFTQGKAWPDLAKLLHDRAGRLADTGERAKLLFKVAQLEEERVGDLAAAAVTLETIVGLEPSNERASRALVRVLEARQDWAGLVQALKRDLALRTSQGQGQASDREDLLLRIAQLQEARLADMPAAFATLREVLQVNPLSAAAVAGLERIGAAPGLDRVEIARLSVPLYQRTDNTAKLAAALEILAEADSGPDRLKRLQKLRSLYTTQQKDPAAAYRAAVRIFDIDPADQENREQLLALAAETQAVGDLVDRMRAVADAIKDQKVRRDLLVEIAELHEQRLGRAGDAERVYSEILQVEPTHAGAFRALTRLYRDGERWPELRALLGTRQSLATDPRERLDLLAQIAEIDESVLEDADHAVASYEAMLQLDPTDLRAHRALDRHYAARERWQDLEQLLGARIALASAAEVPELEFRRAELRATKFNDIDGALELLESIVARAPSHEGARRLLERLLVQPTYRQRASKILEPLYEASGAWARLVTVLEMQREALQGDEAATLLARIADLQENKLQARMAALATWRQVLAADPHHPDALGEIERLATVLERFSELVDVYQELAFNRDTGDISGRADLLSRAARLYAGRLGNRRAAIEVWKLVLNLDPNAAETGRPAAAALEGLYAETGDVVSLVKILRQQARWADNTADRRAILFRVAGLEEKSLNDTDGAVGTLRAILEIDPENREAIDALERIFETGSQHRQRVEILRRRIDLARDPAARQELWRRVASLLERDVGDVEEAIAACVSILDENPEDANALDTLARLYQQQGRHRDRLEILERRLALLSRGSAAPADVAARVEILRQIGGLLEGPLGDPADALERWRQILPLAPGDPEALAALERFLQPGVDAGLRLAAAQAVEDIYQKTNNWAALAAVVQVYIESQDDPHARVEQLARLANLQETRLRDGEAAFRSYGLAIREAISEPELPSFLDAYERLAGAARAGEVAALYREITPDVMDEGIKLRLDRFVAESSRLGGDLDQAAEFYRRVLDRVPDDDASLAALEQIYREKNDTALLYEVLTRRAEMTKDPVVERGLRLQLGALGEKQLDRLDDAIAAYERVAELAPRERAATEALERLYTQTERWSDLARFLGQTLERGLPEREVVAIRFRLANIEHDQQHDKERALEHLRVVLNGDPDHPGAIAMLEGMLDDLAVQGSAAELLEPVYAGRADWPSLIKIGEIRLLQVEEPAERLAWTKRIARLYEEQLEDFESALRWYGRVFQEAPTERLSAEQLLRLADKLNRWQDVAGLFASYLNDELGEGPAVLDVVRRAAEIFDLRLGNREEARKYYRRLFDARPDDAETAALIEGAFERWESWLELRELFDERSSRAADPAAKKTLLRRSAKLDEEHLDDRGRAVGTLREVLEIDPGDQEAAQELERLLREDGQWHDLAEHLAFSLDRAGTPAERDAIAFRLANLLESKLEDVSGAIDRYAEIVERSPTHREAVASLERLVRDPDHRYRVATILEPIYRKAGDFRRLVVALDAQLDSVEDRDDRVKILGEMADIYQRLARLDLAFDCRSRAWLVDVSSQSALSAMQTLASSARLFAPLAETLEKGALAANDPELQGQLWSLAARAVEEHLGDQPRAIEDWRHALSSRPDDVSTYVALERLLTAAARMTELVEVLEKHLEVATATHHGDRKLIAKRIAVLYEEALRQPESAIRAWQSVLEIDDADHEALDALAALFHRSAAWRELADIYERKILMTQTVADRRVLRLQAAQIYDDKLGAPEEAVGQLRAVLDDAENDADALERLDKLLTREGRHNDLLEVLDLRRNVAGSPAERDQLAFRAARLVESDLSDTEAAIGRYRQMLVESPRHDEARAALWAIARGDDYRPSAITTLEPILRQARDWDGVVELLELRLAVEDDVAGRLRVLAEIARIDEFERKDPKRAFDAWARALTEEATADEPREALERLSASRGDYAGLARVYEERMDATFDAGLQRTLAIRLADLYETRLADLARAAEFLRKALSLPGDEAEVLANLDRVLRRTGAHHDLAEVLVREAELSPDPTEQADFLAALGEIRLRSMDDAEGALSAFRDALERNPAHRGARDALSELLSRPDTREGALEILEPMAEARGDYEELVALYDYRLSLHDDRTERAHWLRRIAEVYDTQLRSPERAIEALGRALKEEPFPGAALDDIERIATAGQIPSDAAELIEAVLPLAEGESARELALRAARLYEATPRERGSAERLYTRVLESDPENVDALTALETFHRASGDSVRLANVLERRAGIELDPNGRRRMLMEAARLHEKTGSSAAAIAAWQTLRAAEEGDAEVLGELARLYERVHDLPALCEVLTERARFSEDPTERAALYARIGQIKLTSLADLDGAAEAYREAMEGAPENVDVLSALERIETERQDWAALQEVLVRRLGAVSGAAQTDVLQKLARNAEEKLSDTEQATGYLHQILGSEPGNTLAHRELERILRASERWYDLVDVLTKHAEVEADAGRMAAALELRVSIADVWEQKLDSPDSAAEALEKVLEVAPTNVAALLSLARLHEAAERWDDARQALERAAAAATSGRDAAEIHYRSAQILRAQRGDGDGAGAGASTEVESLLLRALDSDQTHRPTLAALEKLAREANEPDRLVQLLQLQLEISEEDAERKKLLAEIAALYKGPIRHPGQAIPYLELLTALAPEDTGPREDLAEALLAAGRADEAAQLMRQLVEQLTKARRGKDVARYHQRLGAIAEAKGDLTAAADSFNAAYKLDPSQPATLIALGRLALQRNEPDNARKFYRALLLQNFDEASSGVSKAEVYLVLGRLHLLAKEVSKARNMFERGLEIDPKNADLKHALATLPAG